jgi:hypothetical protein
LLQAVEGIGGIAANHRASSRTGAEVSMKLRPFVETHIPKRSVERGATLLWLSRTVHTKVLVLAVKPPVHFS